VESNRWNVRRHLKKESSASVVVGRPGRFFWNFFEVEFRSLECPETFEEGEFSECGGRDTGGFFLGFFLKLSFDR
jgi:hypothetical protein